MNQALNADVEDEPAGTSHETAANAASRSLLAARSRNAKHIILLGSFLGTLDLIFFVQLSTIYYLDCRLATFLLRALTQLIVLSPRVPSTFPPPANFDPTAQPLIGIIFSTNLICFLIHLFGTGPQAGEVTQFYNYGGIFVDFIGERTPISKFRVILLDVLVCGLQIVMLAALIEKIQLSKLQVSVGRASTSDDSTAVNQTGTQNLDAEERGVMALDHEDDPLLSGSSRADGEEAAETDLASSSSTAHPLDPFSTGRFVVADTNLTNTIKEQWLIWKRGPAVAASASGTSENGSTNAASAAGGSTGTTPATTQTTEGVTTMMTPFGFRVRLNGRVIGV